MQSSIKPIGNSVNQVLVKSVQVKMSEANHQIIAARKAVFEAMQGTAQIPLEIFIHPWSFEQVLCGAEMEGGAIKSFIVSSDDWVRGGYLRPRCLNS